jgi:5-methylcytosine-specific restriction endonuclease McrA
MKQIWETKNGQVIDKPWLELQYIDQRLSLQEIGNLLGVTRQMVHRILKRFNIPSRNSSEAKLNAMSKGRMVYKTKYDTPQKLNQLKTYRTQYHQTWLNTGTPEEIAIKKEMQKQSQLKYNISENGRHNNAMKNLRYKEVRKKLINTLTYSEWIEIIQKQDYKCADCHRLFSDKLKPTKDHIHPASKTENGGVGLTKENTQALCKSCNSRKRDKVK